MAEQGLLVISALDREDVLAVKLAEIEGQLLAQDEDLKAEIARLYGTTSDLEKALNRAVLAQAADALKEKVAEITASLRGFSAKVDVTTDGNLGTTKSGHLNVRMFLRIRTQNGMAQVNKTTRASKQVVALNKDLVGTQDRIGELKGEVLEVRQKLSKMPVFERQIKGAVARHRLGQSDEGKGILDQIDSLDINGLPQLPGKKG